MCSELGRIKAEELSNSVYCSGTIFLDIVLRSMDLGSWIFDWPMMVMNDDKRNGMIMNESRHLGEKQRTLHQFLEKSDLQ